MAGFISYIRQSVYNCIWVKLNEIRDKQQAKKISFTKKVVSIFLFAACSIHVLAQTATTKALKSLNVWVYTGNGTVQKGILMSVTPTTLLIYPGNMKEYKKGVFSQTVRINYENLTIIKIKKSGGLFKGLLIGGGIGLAPIIFGQGGAFVAIFSFPLGIIVGAIIGATSKKKYKINEDPTVFRKFTNQFVK